MESDAAQILDMLNILEYPVTAIDEGHVLIEEDSTGNEVYVLLEGEVSVTQFYREVAMISTKGAIIGEVAAILGVTRTATVTVTKPSRFYVINDLLGFLGDQTAIAVVVLKSMAQQIIERDKHHSGIYTGLRRLRERESTVVRNEKLTANQASQDEPPTGPAGKTILKKRS